MSAACVHAGCDDRTCRTDEAKAARLRLLAAATHAGGCHDKGDQDGELYWQAEADAARIALCEARGDVENACYWRAYFIDRHGHDVDIPA